jgi:CubicO group peptidase (beta-lactamase class C family)
MFTTAGFGVASAGGMPWDQFVTRRIFGPLGMKSACCTTTAAARVLDRASPHRFNARERVEALPAWYALETPDPAGSINASCRDLASWVRFQLGDGTWEGKRLVSAANLAETHTPQTIIPLEGQARDLNPFTDQMTYGMGWVIQDYHGWQLVSHAGAIDGFRCHFTLVPKANIGIVILANMHQTRLNLATSNRLVDLLLGLPRKDWNRFIAGQLRKEAEAAAEARRKRYAGRHPDTKPSRALAAYAAVYEHPAYGSARVTLDRDTLVWQWSTFSCPLEHFHYDTFTATSDVLGEVPIVFMLDGDGVVRALEAGGLLHATFRRVKPARP